jgi:hypothetical protein
MFSYAAMIVHFEFGINFFEAPDRRRRNAPDEPHAKIHDVAAAAQTRGKCRRRIKS